jgi:hypothetical protein
MSLMPKLIWCGVSTALVFTASLAAQSTSSSPQPAPAQASPCDSLTPDTPHSDALRGVCQYAVTIPERMPNFTCQQTTSRYVGDQAADVVTAIVTYEGGTESYKDLRLNGRPVADAKSLNPGTWSTGQFGNDIRALFDAGNKVTFQFVNESKIAGRRALTFQYRVEHQDVPLWRLRVQDRVIAPPYHGQLWIDEAGILLRLQVVATQIPRTFPMLGARLQIDYGDVLFGDGTRFVLPLKAVVSNDDLDGRHNRNVAEFHNCHKFRGTARIVPQ